MTALLERQPYAESLGLHGELVFKKDKASLY